MSRVARGLLLGRFVELILRQWRSFQHQARRSKRATQVRIYRLWSKVRAEETYIVLCSAREDSDCPSNFKIPSNDRINLPLPRHLRQINRILRQRFILLLRILRIDPRTPRRLLHGCFPGFGRDARLLQCLLKHRILEERRDNMILGNIGILLSFLNGLGGTEEFEGCRG